jgi:DNA-binding NarL/FixJ family response regulator
LGLSMKIMIVEKHILFRQGLQSLLSKEPGFEVVGVADSCREAVDKALTLQPDVVLLAIGFPDGSGLGALREIVAHRPESNVVILTTHDSDEYLFGALRSGAQGYILKDTPVSQLVAALKGLEQGQLAISRAMATRVINDFSRLVNQSPPHSGAFDRLSQREIDVLREVGSGGNNREIAARLGISEHTVKIHVRNMEKKLALENRAQIASYARRYGL